MSDPINTHKRETLCELLQRGQSTVWLVTSREAVQLPPAYLEKPVIKLHLSWNFAPQDMQIDEWGVRSTLSFEGTWHKVAFPWAALFGMAGPDGNGTAYKGSEPTEQELQPRAPVPAPAPKPRHLRLVH